MKWKKIQKNIIHALSYLSRYDWHCYRIFDGWNQIQYFLWIVYILWHSLKVLVPMACTGETEPIYKIVSYYLVWEYSWWSIVKGLRLFNSPRSPELQLLPPNEVQWPAHVWWVRASLWPDSSVKANISMSVGSKQRISIDSVLLMVLSCT